MKKIILLSIAIFASQLVIAQHKHGGNGRGHPHRHVAARHHSMYRPNKVIVFHPLWHPRRECHRRWVYFPRQNFYWDNWRNHYVFISGTIWVSQSAPPAQVSNLDLSKEKSVELKDNDDDNDEIFAENDKHKTEIKPD